MIYAGACMEPETSYTTATGARVEVVRITLEPASYEQIKQMALDADREQLLATVGDDDRLLHGSEDELLMAKFLESVEPPDNPDFADYQHSAYCTACLANASDAEQDAGYRRRIQLTDRRHLWLIDAQAADVWAKDHAAACTTAPPNTP